MSNPAISCRFGALALFLGLSLLGCGQANEFKPPPPPTVTVAQPVEREVTDYLEFTGSTQAAATVDLRARVNGYLREIRFKDGADVKQGDLLFMIEPRPFEIALQAAEAQQKKAEAMRQKADANFKLQQASYRRVSELIQRQASSQQELDVQAAQLASAQADVATAVAEAAAAQAAIASAKQNLAYSKVYAPIDGRIGRHLVDPGNLVTAEQTLLATIENIDPILAYFYITDTQMMRFMELRRENKIPDPETTPPALTLIVGNDASGHEYPGTLDFLQLSVDAATGTVMRRGKFENPKRELVPGLFVRIRSELGEPTRKLLVESRALGADQRGDFVLVVDEKNVVEHRPVTLGIEVGELRVVEQGLKPDEWIVVNGLQRARPNTEVNPQKPAADTNKSASTPSSAEARGK